MRQIGWISCPLTDQSPSSALPVYKPVENEGKGAGDTHLGPAGHGDAAVGLLADVVDGSSGHPAAEDDCRYPHSWIE